MAPVDKEGALKVDDVESRLWLQTKTQSGQNWDQVLGVSQRIINKNFEQLYNMYKTDMGDMYDSNEVGMIDAKLLAPRIIIPGGNTSANKSLVYFQLRFESGSMSNASGTTLIEDLSNWVITCEVKIDSVKATINDSMTEAAKAKVRKDNAWIDRFDVAGDYSAERLYAKLSSINWTQPQSDYTICGLDDEGKPISYRNWQAEDTNRAMYLSLWLMQWCAKQDAQGRNNIGLSVQIPPVQNTKQPTYESIFMMNQSYVYKSEKQGAIDGATGDTGAGVCNAFLYTEIVKIPGLSNTRRPDDITLVWSGNFCTLPKTVGGDDAIDGTFVFGRNVFLESFMLPELRAINKAFDIYHAKPYGKQQSDGRISSYEPYSIGLDENHRYLNDAVFDFHNVNDSSDPDKLNGYYYEKTNEQPWVVTVNTGDDAGDLRAQSKGQSRNPPRKKPSTGAMKAADMIADHMRIDVTWEAGGSVFTVTGKATSHEASEWTHQGAGRNFNDLWCHAYADYDISFQFKMQFTTKPGPNNNGVLHVFVIGGEDNVKVTINPKIDNTDGVEDNHSGPFKEKLDDNLGQVIPTMIKNLQQKLAGSGQFVFPGNGVFDFVNPMMSRYGHLLAEVKYKPLTQKQLFVPRPPKPTKPVVVDATLEIPVKTSNEPKWQLDWTFPVNPVASALKKNKVVLRAENKDPEFASQFKYIVISWTSSSKGLGFFAEDQWALASTGDAPANAPAGTPAAAPAAAPAGTLAGTPAGAHGASAGTPAGAPAAASTPAGTPAGVPAGTPAGAPAGTPQAASAPDGAPAVVPAPAPAPAPAAFADPAPTPAPAPVPAPSRAKPGLITLRQSATGKDAAVLRAPSHATSKWTMNIAPSDAAKPFMVKPGGWIELEFEGIVGPAGAFSFTILENWAQKDTTYFRDSLNISVTHET
ncbi:hypothetical protein SEUCBS140593_003727 [Sporothrix eucalyptigena]|uniref:Uncharacterized protein n=1 Tax=Sporothrix eucalyptigena TaxID=1812306 RepID=A0ABP0BHB5_9PEZI